jgi:Protein of unknown function (DUF2721)
MTAAIEVLTAMITPAVLISASGTLVLSTSNRLTRVVDRVRTLAKEAREPAETLSAEEAERRRTFFANQLVTLTARVSLLRTAMTVLYSAIGLFIMTSIAVGLLAALGVAIGWLPVAFALAGTGALLHASWLLVREARLAVVSTLEEMSSLAQAISAPEAK